MSLLASHGWHEWLCHTNFSFLVGASHPGDYLRRAVALGYAGIGVTDFDGVYGLARTHLALQKLGARTKHGAFKLTHGAELHLAQDHVLPVLLQDTIVLVAQTLRGYANLCRLCTYAHRGGKHDAYVPLVDLLGHPVDDLIAIQPMRGFIRRAPPYGQNKLLARNADLLQHFGGRFYLAVSRHFNPSEDVWIGETMALARRLGQPLLLTQDPFFHEPRQKDLSDLLHAIRTNKTMDEAVPHMFVNSERCLHALDGIEKRFQSLPGYEASLRLSRTLVESCTFDMQELRYRYPKEMLPEGHTAQSYLEHLTWTMAGERYGTTLSPKMAQVLTHELDLIQQLEFADYFLTVWDIVRWARSQDILCQGRGSAANSAVCFVLGVTAVDPSLFDLLFERFISVERGDPPDIDVDFEHERREEVIRYIYERYGRDKAAMVANVITFRTRGAIRAVGKALGVPESHLKQAAVVLQSRHFRGASLDETMQELKHKSLSGEAPGGYEVDERGEDDELDHLAIPWNLWAQMAERLREFPRHLGIHSGGFMLADRPLTELTAQEPATMAGRTVVQWSKDDIEGLGFFKIDVLALGMLTAMRKCFTAIAASYGQKLSLTTIPQDDQPTYAMIQRADTVGTFQIESRAQMSMLPRLRPKTLYDLVVEVAIIRPGPIQGGMIHPYLRRRDGLEPVSFPDERLRPILARTLGIPIFQEQVMRIAIAVGGFTAGEANELRKNIGSFSIKGNIGPWLERLAEGMRKNGLKEEFVQGILAQMRGFADYGFPESHSVSFALLAYASSYLKCHYPAAFFMALLNSQPMGFYAPHVLVQTAQRDGVKVLPICVQKSAWDCTLENVAAPGRPAVSALRLGLRYVTSLRAESARYLEATRERLGGTFQSLQQLLSDVRLFRPDVTALAAANAFAAFGLDRRAAIWLAEAAPFCPHLEDIEDEVAWREETTMERIEQDFQATSTTLGPHPVVVIRTEHWCYDTPAERLTLAQGLAVVPEGRKVEVFGMVLVRQSPPSANGMVFLTLEDETGFINLVFTPQVYAQFHRLVESQAFLCVQGRLQRQRESHALVVRHIHEPRIARADVIPLDLQTTPAPTAQVLQRSRNYM